VKAARGSVPGPLAQVANLDQAAMMRPALKA